MAKVPVYNDLQVAPSNVQQIEYGRQANVFAGLGQGLQQAGQGLEVVAEEEKRRESEIEKVKAREAKQMAELLAQDAVNRYSADLKRNGAQQKQMTGQDAFKTSTEFLDNNTKSREKIRAELSHNPLAQSIYDRDTFLPTVDAEVGITTHTAIETKKFQEATFETAVSNNNLMAVQLVNTGDQKVAVEREAALRAADNAIRNKMDGESDVTIQAAQAANRSNNTKQSVFAQIDRGFYDAAKGFAARHDAEMNELDRADVAKRLQSVDKTQKLYTHYDSENAKAVKDNEAALAQGDYTNYSLQMMVAANKIENKEDRDAFVSAFKRDSEIAKGVQIDRKAAAFETVKQAIQRDGRLTTAIRSSPEYQGLSADAKATVAQMSENRAAVVTNTKLYAELHSQLIGAKTEADVKSVIQTMSENLYQISKPAEGSLVKFTDEAQKRVTGQEPGEFGKNWEQAKASIEGHRGAAFDGTKMTDQLEESKLKVAFYSLYPKYSAAGITEKQGMINQFIRDTYNTTGKAKEEKKSVELVAANLSGVKSYTVETLLSMDSGGAIIPPTIINKSKKQLTAPELHQRFIIVERDYAKRTNLLQHEAWVNSTYTPEQQNQTQTLMQAGNKKVSRAQLVKELYRKAQQEVAAMGAYNVDPYQQIWGNKTP